MMHSNISAVGRRKAQDTDNCPYCETRAFQISDNYDDGGYRRCGNDHVFHVDDW